MTIIIGKRHEYGLIMGADTEETGPTLKRSVPKLLSYKKLEKGALVIGGAGPAPYIEDISEQLLEYFGRHTTAMQDLEAHLREAIRNYYNASVLSWPTREEREDYDFSLIIGGILYDEAMSHLWISESGALARVPVHAAIGLGAEHAKTILDGHQWEGPLSMYALLAIYTLQKVKQNVSGCGKESEIVSVGRVTQHIPVELIKEAEQLFEQYDDSAKQAFVTTIYEPSSYDDSDKKRDAITLRKVRELRAKFRKLIKKMRCHPHLHWTDSG